MDDVNLLREQVSPYQPPPDGQPIPAYLGIDIGSVSTNLVAMDAAGQVIHDIYLRTAGRPIEAVQKGLTELDEKWGRRLVIEAQHHEQQRGEDNGSLSCRSYDILGTCPYRCAASTLNWISST